MAFAAACPAFAFAGTFAADGLDDAVPAGVGAAGAFAAAALTAGAFATGDVLSVAPLAAGAFLGADATFAAVASRAAAGLDAVAFVAGLDAAAFVAGLDAVAFVAGLDAVAFVAGLAAAAFVADVGAVAFVVGLDAVAFVAGLAAAALAAGLAAGFLVVGAPVFTGALRAFPDVAAGVFALAAGSAGLDKADRVAAEAAAGRLTGRSSAVADGVFAASLVVGVSGLALARPPGSLLSSRFMPLAMTAPSRRARPRRA